MRCETLQYIPDDDVYTESVWASEVIGCEFYVNNLVEIKPNKDNTETHKLIFEYEDKLVIFPRVKIRFDSFFHGEVSLVYPDNKGNHLYEVLKQKG